MKILLVIAFGILVGVTIEILLSRRQRARLVVLDPPDLPPGTRGVAGVGGDRGPGPAATDATVVVDDDGGVRILGPVVYDDAPSSPWDASADVDPLPDDPPATDRRVVDDGRGDGAH